MGSRGHSRRRKGDGCRIVECYTPRRVVARWLSGLRSSKGKRMAGEEQDVHTGGYQLAPIRCSTQRLNQTRAEISKFESQSKEAPLEMGIGFFLLYLVVTSKNELDKMVNLRIQMEKLLLNAKQELQKKEFQESPPMSSNVAFSHHASELTDCQFSPRDISNLASSTSVLQEENTECEVSKREDGHRGTDQISKLQGEEDRLLLVGKAEDRHTKHQTSRQYELKDNEVMKNHIAEMVVKDERYGVCPYELEKKLHTLLVTRQQEELLKLERRVQEKETEVSWWKDAACLLAQRVPESSRGGLEWCNPEYSTTSSEQSVSGSFDACPKHRISVSR